VSATGGDGERDRRWRPARRRRFDYELQATSTKDRATKLEPTYKLIRASSIRLPDRLPLVPSMRHCEVPRQGGQNEQGEPQHEQVKDPP